MSVLNTKSKYTTRVKCSINDMGVQRFDVLKYRQFDKLTEKQLGSLGDHEEVDIQRRKRL